MKKDLVGLVSFLLENGAKCAFDSNHQSRNKIGFLEVSKNGIKVNLTSDDSFPELVQISIHRPGRSYLINEMVPTEDAKELIVDIWKRIEISVNKNFIKDYGYNEYKMFYDAYISALKGEKENERFTFEVTKSDKSWDITLNEKESEKTSYGVIYHMGYLSGDKIHGAREVKCRAFIKSKISNTSSYEGELHDLKIFIPSIELKNYILGRSVEKSYTKENMFTHLMENIYDEEDKKLLAAFELMTDLSEKSTQPKKLKI